MEVVKSVAFSLATVLATMAFKTIEQAILGQADMTQILAIQYELIIIAVSVLIAGHAAAPYEKQGLFVRPLVGVGALALGMLFLLAITTIVTVPLATVWLTVVVPDVLGFVAIAWAVYTMLEVKR